MIPKVFREFIAKVKLSTERHEIKWVEADSRAYYCDHKQYTLHISSHFDPDRDESTFFFRMSVDGRETPFSVRDVEEDYQVMRDFYEAVLANANDVASDLDGFFD